MPDARSGAPTAQDARYWCGLVGGSWLKAVAFRVTVDSGQLRVYATAAHFWGHSGNAACQKGGRRLARRTAVFLPRHAVAVCHDTLTARKTCALAFGHTGSLSAGDAAGIAAALNSQT